MGEIETDKQGQDGSEKPVEEGTDTSKDNNGADKGNEGASADDNNDGGSDDEEETDDDEGADDDKKSQKPTSKDDKDEDKEPPTRKRPVDFIRERQERRKAKQGDQGKAADEDEDDDIDPADKETIGKVVAKALKPFVEEKAKAQDEQEIKDFLNSNPDFKPYEAKARKYMSHPSRKDVPIEEIFYGVAGKDLLRIGAKRAKIADDEARKTRSAGGASDAGGAKSNADLTREELEAKQQAVRAKLADR